MVEVKSTQKVIVTGEGNSEVAAFSSALGRVQSQMLKESSDVTLRIQPKAVTVLSATKKSYTERFLFFFLPREKVTYSVKLQIEVELLSIDMKMIDFKEQGEQARNFNIPFFSQKMK
uniref:DUF4312 family protein n=1 Tax=Candidatus Enterococcus willemsii TaxID=1857215 RepID=UPI00403F22AE